jgi:hypothetical protein
LAVLCSLVSACDAFAPCPTGSHPDTFCSTKASGTGTLVLPQASPAQHAFSSTGGECGSSCQTSFSFRFNTGSGELNLQCWISTDSDKPQALSVQTLTLPSDHVWMSCTHYGTPGRRLELVSGTFSIDKIERTAMHATFTVDLASDDGATLHVANGVVSISGCHEEEVCSY